MKFKEAWDKLEAKICLQRQSTEYLFAFYVFINCSNSKKFIFWPEFTLSFSEYILYQN